MNGSYEILAKFLHPVLDEEVKTGLLRDIRSGSVDWNELLLQANHQMVTPLWFLCLKQNDLLSELPQDLSEYLGQLYSANRDRNAGFVTALEEVLRVTQSKGVSPVLLKGAAAFADNLYGDIGARIMSDLDILLPYDQAVELSETLKQQGYLTYEHEEALVDNTLPTEHHHHVKPLRHPDLHAPIEIHYRVSRGRDGEAFKNAPTETVKLSGYDCCVLTPEYRELHNLLHAMVNDRGTIKSFISLKAVAESAWLKQRYSDADFTGTAKVAASCGCMKDYRLYRSVSQRLGLWSTEDKSSINTSTFRANRCIDHGNSLTKVDKFFWLSLYLGFYEKWHFPRWAWNYLCYLDKGQSFGQRIRKMLHYFVNPVSWKRI